MVSCAKGSHRGNTISGDAARLTLGETLPTGDGVAQERRNTTETNKKILGSEKPINLIIRTALSVLFHQLAGNSLFFPVKDGRRLFIVLPLFEFTNDALFFYHPLKAFDGFLKQFVVINDNMRQKISPPFPVARISG